MPEKKPRVFHPSLFALYPVLFFYDLNKHEVWFSETWLPMAVALTVTLLFLALFRLIFQKITTAGIFVSFCLIGFFFYEAILSRVSGFTLGNFILSKDPDLSWSYGIFLILLFMGIKTIKDPFHGFTRFLNIVAVVLIIFPLANIALHKLKNPSVLLEESASVKKGAQGDIDAVGSKPDIYYIILDAYGREDVLREFYGYDNSEFIGFLKDRGFHIAHKSRSNYPVTVPSLASSLNMNYVEQLAPLADQNKKNLLPLNRLIEDNEAVRFLKSIGYRYIHFSSGISVTRSNRNADIIEAPPKQLTPFAEYLINKTFMKTFKLSYFDPAHIKRKTILHVFDKLEEVPGIKEPTFAFAHMLMPHGPYVFDKDGNIPPNPDGSSLRGYLDFLTFTNGKIMRLIDKILSESEAPPIIILQADHGGEFKGQCIQPDAALLKERMSILNAYYLPHNGYKDLYESITPVNSFRLIFDHYFGTNLGFLEDKSYFTFCYGNIYEPVLVPDESHLPNHLAAQSKTNLEWVKSLLKAVETYPNYGPAYNALGVEYLKSKRYQEAEKYFKQAIKTTPQGTHHLFYNNIGKVYLKLKDYQKAIDSFREGTKKSSYPPLYNNLGFALIESKRFQEAIKPLEKSIQLNPDSPNGHLNLGVTFFKLKRFKEAIKPLKRVANINPSLLQKPVFLKAHSYLGKTFMELNRYPEAIKHYRDVLRHDSSNAQAHYQLGLVYDEIGDGKQAIIESIVAKQLLRENNDSSLVAEIEAQLKTLFAKYSYRPEDFAGVKALIRR